MIRLALAGFAVLVGGCHFSISDIAKVPDNPTFELDIKPLMADHCVLCHGSPPARGAPGNFRLDVYDDVGAVRGAGTVASRILDEVQKGSMPPSASWGDGVGSNGKAMLRKWIELGAPK